MHLHWQWPPGMSSPPPDDVGRIYLIVLMRPKTDSAVCHRNQDISKATHWPRSWWGQKLNQQSTIETRILQRLRPRPKVTMGHRCTQGGWKRRGFRSEKLSHKDTLKHEKGDPLGFLTTPSTPLKRIWSKPQGPPWISNYCASMQCASMRQTAAARIHSTLSSTETNQETKTHKKCNKSQANKTVKMFVLSNCKIFSRLCFGIV